MSPPLAADNGTAVAKKAVITNVEQILRHRLIRTAGIRIRRLLLNLGRIEIGAILCTTWIFQRRLSFDAARIPLLHGA